MKLIRYQGELSVSGTNVLMKLCLEKQRKIERVIAELPEGDGLFRSRIFNLLNRAWWAEWFKIRYLCGGNFADRFQESVQQGEDQCNSAANREITTTPQLVPEVTTGTLSSTR